MNEPKPLATVIKLAGGQVKLGKLIGASQQQISYWLNKRKGLVPVEYALLMQAAFPGQVIATDLCPDALGHLDISVERREPRAA